MYKLVLLLTILISSCNPVSEEQNMLIGKWSFLSSNTENGTSFYGDDITFRDNTYSWGNENGSWDMDEHWIYLKKKYKYYLSETKLTLKYNTKYSYNFKKE